jgi:hypothetical protein
VFFCLGWSAAQDFVSTVKVRRLLVLRPKPWQQPHLLSPFFYSGLVQDMLHAIMRLQLECSEVQLYPLMAQFR